MKVTVKFVQFRNKTHFQVRVKHALSIVTIQSKNSKQRSLTLIKRKHKQKTVYNIAFPLFQYRN